MKEYDIFRGQNILWPLLHIFSCQTPNPQDLRPVSTHTYCCWGCTVPLEDIKPFPTFNFFTNPVNSVSFHHHLLEAKSDVQQDNEPWNSLCSRDGCTAVGRHQTSSVYRCDFLSSRISIRWTAKFGGGGHFAGACMLQLPNPRHRSREEEATDGGMVPIWSRIALWIREWVAALIEQMYPSEGRRHSTSILIACNVHIDIIGIVNCKT